MYGHLVLGGNVDDVGVGWIEAGRVVDSGSEAVLGGEEAGRRGATRGNGLIDHTEQGLRSVDAFERAAHAIEERVADPVAGANHGLRIDAVRQAQARPKVPIVGMDQAAVKQAAAVASAIVLVVGSKLE